MKIRYALGAVVAGMLAGCASTPSAGEKPIVYDPPPPPASFSLDVYQTPDGSFRVGQHVYSFVGLEGYLASQVKRSTGPYTVLLHPNGDLKVPAYLCYVVLMHQAGAVGYVAGDGKADAPKVTIATNQYGNVRRNCEKG